MHKINSTKSGEFRVLDLFSPSDSSANPFPADKDTLPVVTPTVETSDSFVFVNPLFAPSSPATPSERQA